ADVLEYRHPREDGRDLKAAGQAAAIDLVGRQAVDAPPVELDGSPRYGEAPADQVEESGLAGAVGTDDGVPLALDDVEADAEDGGGRAEALVHVQQTDALGAHPALPSARRSAVAASHAAMNRSRSRKSQRPPPRSSAAPMSHGVGVPGSMVRWAIRKVLP